MTYAHDGYYRGHGFDFARERTRGQRLARIDALATWLDTALVLPGTNVRFGLDAILGLVPGIGDVSAWLYATEFFSWRAFRNRRDEFLRGGEPVLWLLRHSPRQGFIDRVRKIRVQAGWSRELVVEVRPKDSCLCVTGVRRRSGEAFEEDAGERINVRSTIDR